jgi:hypothetical protein
LPDLEIDRGGPCHQVVSKAEAEKAAALAADRQLMEDWWDGTKAAQPAMARIRKMKATTAAGI